MKLRQTEYCHACEKHVVFVFEDFIGRQTIICPTPGCGHKHYREIDEAVITAVRLNPTDFKRDITMVNIPGDEPLQIGAGDFKMTMPRPREVIGVSEDGFAITADGPGKKTKTKVVTGRRWNTDLTQVLANPPKPPVRYPPHHYLYGPTT